MDTNSSGTGTAGDSAQREYERRRKRDEDRLRQRYGRLGGLAVALSGERHSTKAWRIGAAGEGKLAATLAGHPKIRVLNDRRVSGTKGNIDHLVIGPAGVFVVDAKNIRGAIRIRDKGWLLRRDLRLYVGGRDRSDLADRLSWQVEAVLAALETLSTGAGLPVTPVLCFIDGDWPLVAPSECRGVRLESPRSLARRVTKTRALDGPDVERLARELTLAMPAKSATRSQAG